MSSQKGNNVMQINQFHSRNPVQISSILEKIVSRSTKKVEVKLDTNKLRPVDVPKIEVDVSKIENEVVWKREISLDETISAFL